MIPSGEIVQIKEMNRKICGETLNSNSVREYHRVLCLRYQGRFTGSANAHGAAQYIQSVLESHLLDGLMQQPFDCVHWQRGPAVFQLISPVVRNLPAIALPYCPAFKGEFELIDAGMCSESELKPILPDLKGKAVLVDDRNPGNAPALHRLQKYIKLYEAKAGAFIFVNRNPGMLAPTGSLAFNPKCSLNQALPSVGISMETASEIREFHKETTCKVAFSMQHDLKPETDVNVIGWIDGTNPDDYCTIVCAHYDGHDIAQGADDNASGTAVVMELARVLAPLKHHLRGRIYFILFSGEEMGLLGSYAFINKYLPELPPIRFVFNLDCVGGDGPLSLVIQEDFGVDDFFRCITEQMPATALIERQFMPFSDHFPFLRMGIPCAFCASEHLSYRSYAHTTADTFEKISLETLQRITSHIGRYIIAVDAADHWPGKYQDREIIQKNISQQSYDVLLAFENRA